IFHLQFATSLHTFAHRVCPFLVTLDPRQTTLPGPASIPIHDDGNVSRNDFWRRHSYETLEKLNHVARDRCGLDGKARVRSMSAATSDERATPPDSLQRSRPPGWAA